MMYREIRVNGQWPKELTYDLIEQRHQITNERLFEFYGYQLNDYVLRNAPYYNKDGIWSKNCSKCHRNFPREPKYWRSNSSKDGMTADCLECRRKQHRETQEERMKDPAIRAKQRISNKNAISKINSKTKEKDLVNELNTIFNGKTEVTTNYGRIDILTNNTIYEVKEWRMWKAAVGQVMAYALEYPNHHRCIILYSKKTPKNLEDIVKVCLHYNVEVEFLLRE